MSLVTPNFEEAATIASEFIYSLDNLPNEVSHLLQEIKHRETRAQELQQDIDKDSAKYVRHSLRAANATPSTPSSRAASPKSSLLPAKIAAHYAKIQELSSEKCLLAQRLIDLITLSRARLDSDLVKVRILQGETIEPPSVSKATIGESLTASVRNPALAHATESLRVALASAASPDARAAYGSPTPTTASATVGGSVTKKRRITASLKASPTASPLKGRSASPASAATPHAAHPRSRLSRQIHLAEPEEVDMDAEGEEDDEDAEGEDTKLYCFCQKQSFGDMIACDNEGGCPYEWFHLSCIGMKQPLPEKWYCSECKPKMTGATFSRKGRKK